MPWLKFCPRRFDISSILGLFLSISGYLVPSANTATALSITIAFWLGAAAAASTAVAAAAAAAAGLTGWLRIVSFFLSHTCG